MIADCKMKELTYQKLLLFLMGVGIFFIFYIVVRGIKELHEKGII